MKLYHFTSTTLLESILDFGLLPTPHKKPNGEIARLSWYTKSPTPDKTGVPDGKITMNESDVKYHEELYRKKPRNLAQHNKREIRITIDSSILKFERFLEWSRRNGGDKLYEKHIGLSACYDLNALPDDKLRKLLNKKDSSDERNWFILEQNTPPSLFEKIEFNSNGKWVEYNYTTHGVKKLEESGIIDIPSSISDQILRRIKTSHAYETPKAVLFCENSDSPMTIIIRSYLSQIKIECKPDDKFTIERNFSTPDNTISDQDIREWVDINRMKFDPLWELAKEKCIEYNY